MLLSCILQNSFGQVTGRLVAADGKPIPFANILLLNSKDTTLVKATITSENGDYRIENILPGRYILRCSSTGFQTWDSPLFELTDVQKSRDFGTLVLKEAAKNLGEVVVQAAKPLFQQRVDGMVVNVGSSILAKGSSALQVLERSPGVIVNYQNNSISLNGKTGVTVMLDGKLMHMPMDQVVALLNGMSADNIEKIELLTTPPAKYDAEGSAGMINIVLKKNKRPGTNGSVSLTGGYGWGEKGVGSINLAHNTKKIQLYGSYTYTHDRSYSYLSGTGTQNFPALGGPMDVLFVNTYKPVQNDHDATLGLDARLDPKTKIGASITFSSLNVTTSAYNHRVFDVLPDSLLTFDGKILVTNRWRSLINSVYLEKEISEGEKITYDIDYLYYKNDNPTGVQSSFVNKAGEQAGTNNDTLYSPDQRGSSNTDIRVGVGKVDYLKQLSKKVKLEAGAKATYTDDAGLSGIESLVNGGWVNRSEASSDIVMKEWIGAAYASVNTKISTSTNLTMGFRYEYSHTRMDNPTTGQNITERKLGELFPDIFLSGKLTDNSDYNLSYTRRISRPTYNDLSSFVEYNDPVSVFTGNPLLRPTITNNLKLGYTYRGYSFSLLLSRDDDPIARYQLTAGPSEDLMYFSPQNLSYQNNLTFQMDLPWKVNEWWSMSGGFVGGWRQYKETYTMQPSENTYFGYTLYGSQTCKLPKKFSIEISGWYNAASYEGTSKTGAVGALDAGIKKELRRNGGTFQLSMTDLLRTIRYSNDYGTLTKEMFDVKSHVTYNPESRNSQIIKLTYSRSFGTGTKSPAKPGAGSKDEQDRIREN